jgi:glycerol-3-phosphate O-acyltransferase
MSERPLVSYEPNPLLAWVYQRFFDHIVVDEAWARQVRAADRRGTVVYVMRNLSFVDFLALDHLTKRLNLPQVRFANDLGLWILEPMGRGWLEALKPRREADDARDLTRAVTEGSSAVLFLKRPPTLLEPAAQGRGKSEGDPFIRTLFDAQRASKTPILLVPQVFVWSKGQDNAQHDLVDAVLGPREWPGKIRTVAQFLANYRHVTLRAGEAVDLRAFLDAETNDGVRPPDDVLVRRLMYVLLRRLERERRAVLGPAKKPSDRLRDEVLRSPKLHKIIADMAGEGKTERRVLTERARGMLEEMEAAPDINAIGALDKAFEAIVPRMYSGMEVDLAGLARLRQASKDATLILLPSHKSHIDYIVLTYVFHHHHLPLPIVAAGDNLNFFPIGAILRRAGAFYIRRAFHGDRLYGAVVDAYVRRLIKDGWPLEFFLEGGRSRTGKLLAPKVGLLSMVVDAVLGAVGRKVYFVPISIGYERLVEERAFVRELTGGEKGKEDVRGMLKSAELIAERYGHLNVQVGELLTLEQVLGEFDPNVGPESLAKMTPARRRAVVTRLAYRVMNEINRVTAVTPSALVATALLTHGRRGLAHGDLVRACERLARTLRRFGARFSPSLEGSGPGDIRTLAIREACELFARAGHLEVHRPGQPLGARDKDARPGPDALYVVPDDARLSLDLSKNLVLHFFVSRAMVATALLSSPAPVETDTLRERVRSLSRLFKYEFQFRADASFEQIYDETLDAMVKDGELSQHGSLVAIACEDGHAQVVLYARMVRNFVEGYRVAARALASLLRGPLQPKDLTKKAITAGERMFLAGEIEQRESVSRPVFENAYHAFVDQGYAGRADGKLTLPESYASADAVKTIESKIAHYLLTVLSGV